MFNNSVVRPRPDVQSNRATPILLLVGGGLVALGSLLPWVQMSSLFGTISLNGVEGDGKITLGLGLVVAVLGFTGLRRSWRGLREWGAVVGLLAGLVAFYDLREMSQRAGEVASQYVHASAGIGPYVVIVGALAAAATLLPPSP